MRIRCSFTMANELYHECEYTQEIEWEADLHELFILCKKNKGHESFIPVNELALHHLPPCHQDAEVLEWLKLGADLTVRLAVKTTSSHRPDVFPDTNMGKLVPGYKDRVGKPYPFARNKSKFGRRVGTGRVAYVDRANRDGSNLKGPCTCKDDCKELDWGKIGVVSAAHVVFDDEEAGQTEVEFFYNSDQDRQEGRTRVLNNGRMYDSSMERDKCEMYFVTHDVQLLERLREADTRWDESQFELHKKNQLDIPVLDAPPAKPAAVKKSNVPYFIISHPHGCNKMFTWGWGKGILTADHLGNRQLIYSIPTCPGSSGANVMFAGNRRGAWVGFSHSGSYPDMIGKSGGWL